MDFQHHKILSLLFSHILVESVAIITEQPVHIFYRFHFFFPFWKTERRTQLFTLFAVLTEKLFQGHMRHCRISRNFKAKRTLEKQQLNVFRVYMTYEEIIFLNASKMQRNLTIAINRLFSFLRFIRCKKKRSKKGRPS